MLPKSNNKYQEDKNQDFINKKQTNFKNLYAKIRKNIKTSFPTSKQKNSLNIINSKKLTEKSNKINNNKKINLLFNKKGEESRNSNNNHVEEIFYNHQDEELFDCDNNNFLNKTQKNVKLLYNNYSKKVINNRKNSKNNINKNKDKELYFKKKKLNYYSNKEKYSKDDEIKNNNTFFILKTKNIKSNKDLKKLNIENETNETKITQQKEKQNSLDKKLKLFVNKKLISKDEFNKTKNLYDKVQSARLGNYDIHKLNININNDMNIETKSDSNKKAFRMNSQKIVKINDREFDVDTINQIKKIKKNRLIRQLTKQNSKNHSMSINTNNKTLLLNETIKDNINKPKKKYSIANIYNYPNIRNNLKQNIPYDKDMIFDSADKKNKDKSETNFFNNYYNMDHTCFNFNNNMNNTINNNINVTINNTNEKNTPKSKNHNNSFSKPYSQEKISSGFYSKPVARLKKRIFNSSSDKEFENSVNNIEINNYDFHNQDNDSLEINNNRIKINYNFKQLIILIKILNQIINTQNKILGEHIQKENILKKEIEEKDKQIKNYKNICLRLMFYIKEEKEINIANEFNQKRYKIQNQILQENNILRKLFVSSMFKLKKNITYRNDSIILDLNTKSFYNTNNNEGDSSINIYHLKKETYNNYSQNKEYNNNILEKNENNNFNYLYNNGVVNKKREKSYENRKDRKNKEKIINNNQNIISNLNRFEENETKSNKKIFYIVKDKNAAFSFEKNTI